MLIPLLATRKSLVVPTSIHLANDHETSIKLQPPTQRSRSQKQRNHLPKISYTAYSSALNPPLTAMTMTVTVTMMMTMTMTMTMTMMMTMMMTMTLSQWCVHFLLIGGSQKAHSGASASDSSLWIDSMATLEGLGCL
jgi:threonine/homoserine/homoserine lactone efflux protein